MSPRALAALFALLAVVAAGPTFAAAQSTATPTSADAGNGALAHDRTVMHVTLHGDGDATWRIRTDLDVSSAQDRAAFRSLVDQYRRTDPPWLAELRTFNDAAERATGRQMAIRNESVASNATNGTITVRAHWTNFSRRDGEFLVARDAFNTTRGTWLDGLTEHQVLIIELPDRPVIRNAPKRVQNGQMRWEGPHDFEAGRPFVEFRASTSPTSALPLRDVLLAGALAGGLVVLAYAAVRRVRPSVQSSTADGESDADQQGPDESPSQAGDGDQPEQPPATSAADENGQEADEPEPVDEELLSDEERVERLLERNGGRMKQANIVKETGWSNAKVSQLLSSMAEEGRVDKLRIGRENLISFPDEDVTEIDEENH